MAVCETCWFHATRRAEVLGTSVALQYNEVLAEEERLGRDARCHQARMSALRAEPAHADVAVPEVNDCPHCGAHPAATYETELRLWRIDGGRQHVWTMAWGGTHYHVMDISEERDYDLPALQKTACARFTGIVAHGSRG